MTFSLAGAAECIADTLAESCYDALVAQGAIKKGSAQKHARETVRSIDPKLRGDLRSPQDRIALAKETLIQEYFRSSEPALLAKLQTQARASAMGGLGTCSGPIRLEVARKGSAGVDQDSSASLENLLRDFGDLNAPVSSRYGQSGEISEAAKICGLGPDDPNNPYYDLDFIPENGMGEASHMVCVNRKYEPRPDHAPMGDPEDPSDSRGATSASGR